MKHWLNGSAEYTGQCGRVGTFSVDEELGYVSHIESAHQDVYGGARPGANLYSYSLVAWT